MAKRKRKAELSGALTDKGAKAVDDAIDGSDVPGPSPNPATNLLIHDVALRAGGRLLRHTLEKGLLRNRYGGSSAKDMIENRSVVQAVTSYVVARVATRSVPGAVIVGSGLIVKTLYDRGRGRRKARRDGDKALRETAED